VIPKAVAKIKGDFWLQSFFVAIYIRKEYNVNYTKNQSTKMEERKWNTIKNHP
jgi:hypothetical protein